MSSSMILLSGSKLDLWCYRKTYNHEFLTTFDVCTMLIRLTLKTRVDPAGVEPAFECALPMSSTTDDSFALALVQLEDGP
jgi:hypothetical protein